MKLRAVTSLINCLLFLFLVSSTLFAEIKPDLELHRLRPGAKLNFKVNTQNRRHLTTRTTSGHSGHKIAGWTGVPYNRDGKYTLKPELEEAVRELHLPMTRFYALGDEKFSLNEAIDKAADFCNRIKVPQKTTVLEFETQGAMKILPPEVWVAGVQHSLKKGYDFHLWEITNEPWNKGALTPDQYLKHFIEVRFGTFFKPIQ